MIQFKNVDFTYTGITAAEIGVKDIDISVKTVECILLCVALAAVRQRLQN